MWQVFLSPPPSRSCSPVPPACWATLGGGEEHRATKPKTRQPSRPSRAARPLSWVTTRQRFRPRHENGHRPAFRPLPPSHGFSFTNPLPLQSGFPPRGRRRAAEPTSGASQRTPRSSSDSPGSRNRDRRVRSSERGRGCSRCLPSATPRPAVRSGSWAPVGPPRRA